MASLDGIDLPRFRRAFDWSRRQLAPFRQQREKILRLLAGSRYGADNLSLSQPIPFLHLLYSVYSRSLVASNPRCMISTRVPTLKPVAHAMEIAINHELHEMRIDQAIRQVVGDALIVMGIMKIGICTYPVEGVGGLIHDYQKPYADAISLDDWVHDMRVGRFDQAGYAGHRFRVPRRALMQDPRYDPAVVKKLAASDRYVYDEWGNLRAEAMSTDRSTTSDGDHEDMLDLWEIWFPREQSIAVFAGDAGGRLRPLDPLYVSDYDGPELGPYFLLRFGDLPDNILPAPPVLEQADAHQALNGLYRKMIKQALRQKTNLIVTGGNDDDAKRHTEAPDGLAIRMDGIPSQELSVGGARPESQQFGLHFKQIVNEFAGNFAALAGLAPNAPTLGQDRMLTETASKQIQGMQESTVTFTKDAMQALAWYWWTDSKRSYDAEVPVPGYPNQSVPVQISPEDREGNWLKLNFQIDPYSLQGETPSAKLNAINEVWQKAILPLIPMMPQMGLAPNLVGYLNLVARLMNNGEINELVVAQQPIGAEEELQDIPKMPAQTTRTNVRVNRPASTGASQGLAMQQSLMGSASPQQEAMLGRPPG